MGADFASQTITARSSDRAVSIWGMVVTALAALGGEAALVAACLTLPLLPARKGLLTRMGLIACAASAFNLGPTSMVVIAPVALALAGFRMVAVRAMFAMVIVTLLAHQIESLPPVSWLSIHPGSIGFALLPTLVTMTAIGPVVGRRAVAALVVSTIASLTLIDAGAARWINYATFTDPVFRLIVALMPLTIAGLFVRPCAENQMGWRGLTIGTTMGVTIALALPIKPISSIMFDESHGSWATIKAPFGPNDFGRAVNYTYSLLFKYAEDVVGSATILKDEEAMLPESGIFVLKMPVQKLSEAFADRMAFWVHSGGRLLVVADHTDLYDTTQNINEALAPRFGLSLNLDAVYNPIGMPTVPVTEHFAALFGRIDAHGRQLPWQTGTSLAAKPVNAVELATFGPSFSEPGDYSHQNRFGPFVPRTSIRFTDHVAIAAFGIGKGAVVVILDSTPWSNFSLFKEQYRHTFRAIIHALERPIALQVWGYGAIVMVVITLISVLWRHALVLAAGCLVLGLTIGSSAQIGWTAFSAHVEGRDYSLRVVPGEKAHFEFLKQLVGPGERNYARIVSAIAKYDLNPISSTPGSEIPDFSRSKRWLLIEPEARQLPRPDELIPHLQRGGDLAILFAPEQAADASVRQWLASLGLYVQKTVGLAVAEDAKPGLLSRKGATLLRDTRAVTGIQPTSLLKDREFDVLLQSYTVRPTAMLRTSGLLILSFSADQFSDDAVGEVWEGIQPSSLGRHRERQLAAALTGEDFVAPFPEDLVMPVVGAPPNASLPAYALFDNGKLLLSGRFDISATDLRPKFHPAAGILSPADNPDSYLADLRDRAQEFILSKCPKAGPTTVCDKRLLSQDAIEWMVTWVADDKGRINVVELLHERRFSGLGSTVNVVFGQ
jgi:hypothetical protein